MSNNISKDYVSFAKKNIYEYLKLIMNKKYKKDIADILTDTYISVRYYNYYEQKYRNFESNINYYLKDKASELMDSGDSAYSNDVKNTYLTFKYILYFDSVLKYDSLKDLISEIEDFRISKMDLYDVNFQNELTNLVKANTKRKKTFLESFANDKFTLTFQKTNNKNVLFTSLSHHITFPKIYSEYSKNKVYNSGIVGEDKLFITYHLTSLLVLNHVIEGEYNLKYIVDFPLSIFEKKDKISRLLNTIDSDVVKDNIIIKFTYSDYLIHKDEIEDLIKQGYKFCIELDEQFDYQEKSKIWLDIFTYIIVKDDLTYDFDSEKIIIKE